MSQHFLPGIDIRILKNTNHQPQTIHTLQRPAKRKKVRNCKYELIKQSILGPVTTPLHQLVRVSLSNKTVVFKKRLISEQRYERENLAPLQCHQTDKIVILKQSPSLSKDGSGSQLRGCKSLLNTKIRDKKLSFQLPRREAFNDKVKAVNPFDILLKGYAREKYGLRSVQNIGEQFRLCPWQSEQGGQVLKDIRRGEGPSMGIRRCL